MILRVLFWMPRILSIMFALFLSLFALDVFEPGVSFWSAMLGLAIHLIPVYLVIIALVVAWRWEWIGALFFFALAVLYLVLAWGRFPWSIYLIISGPLVLIGVLFLLNWSHTNKLQARQ